MKKINQLSKELNLDKGIIYRIINNDLKFKLEKHIIKIQNILHIDEYAENEIINLLEEKQKIKTKIIISNEELFRELQEIKSILKDLISSQKNTIPEIKKEENYMLDELLKTKKNIEDENLIKDNKIKEMILENKSVREIMQTLKVGDRRIKKIKELLLSRDEKL